MFDLQAEKDQKAQEAKIKKALKQGNQVRQKISVTEHELREPYDVIFRLNYFNDYLLKDNGVLSHIMNYLVCHLT